MKNGSSIHCEAGTAQGALLWLQIILLLDLGLTIILIMIIYNIIW